MSKIRFIPGKPVTGNQENTENEFFGHGWSVRQDGEEYNLSYISGAHPGRAGEIAISKEDYNNAWAGKMVLEDFGRKYGIY